MAPDIKIYRNANWGTQAALSSVNGNIPNTLPVPGVPFGILTGPGGYLPDDAVALWIGPNSEADAVWVHDGWHQGQPFLVSVGHPFIGSLKKDVTLFQFTPAAVASAAAVHLLELHYVPLGQRPPISGSIPTMRAPLRRYQQLTAPVSTDTITSSLVPVMGRKRVMLQVDASAAAHAVTVTLLAAVAYDDLTVSSGNAAGMAPMTGTAISVGAGTNALITVVGPSPLTSQANAPWADADYVACQLSTTVATATVRIGWVALDN